jgi:putative polyhydroxyalkanoate system protein
MATLSITKAHKLSHAKAKAAAEKVAADLSERFQLEYAWNGDTIAFERSGLNGELHVGPKEVRLDARLGFLLSAFKPAIEQAVQSEFGKHFGT